MESFNKDMEEKIKKADALLREKQPSKAVTILKEAIKEFPQHPYLYYLLSIARMKCGRFFLAKRALEKANDLLLQNSENLRSLGWVKVMLSELEEGRRNLREAISLDLINPLAYVDLAMSYFHYFEFEEGFKWLERAKALNPNDPFLRQNYKIARKMEKEFSQYSKTERTKLKKEKLDPELQREFRLSVLERFFKRKGLSKDEAEEIKEELELNGFKAGLINTGDNSEKIPSKEEILKRRKEIERELSQMLKEIKSPFTVEHIKDIIYQEEDRDDLMKVVAIFDRGGDLAELNNILEIVNDAWNYFPHKCLGGLCPMEKILEY